MAKDKKKGRNQIILILVLIALVISGGTGVILRHELTHREAGLIFGHFPKPTEPRLMQPIVNRALGTEPKKVLIRRIPKISSNMRMPHAYWGECSKCHLYSDKTVNYSATPVGKLLGEVSSIKKVGPRIRPDSFMPHPAAGRCIMCHDIVIDSSKS
ncbi:MAG: hypothetical protein HQM12_19625 [SAR324 cluster bacterium]|nr:hypothetical protein [SAR324 cluster bacterium]